MKGQIKKEARGRGKSPIASPRSFAYSVRRIKAKKKHGVGVPFACSCSSSGG